MQTTSSGRVLYSRKNDSATGVVFWLYDRDIAQQSFWFSNFVKKISDPQMNSLIIIIGTHELYIFVSLCIFDKLLFLYFLLKFAIAPRFYLPVRYTERYNNGKLSSDGLEVCLPLGSRKWI